MEGFVGVLQLLWVGFGVMIPQLLYSEKAFTDANEAKPSRHVGGTFSEASVNACRFNLRISDHYVQCKRHNYCENVAQVWYVVCPTPCHKNLWINCRVFAFRMRLDAYKIYFAT